MIGTWQPGKLYLPGDLAEPSIKSAPASSPVVNGDFESGDTGWTKEGNVSITDGSTPFAGDWCALYEYTDGTAGALYSATAVDVVPGQVVTASAMIAAQGASVGYVGGDINLVWLDGSSNVIRSDQGTQVNESSGGYYKKATVTATAPAGAEKLRLQIDLFALQAGSVRIDNLTWSYAAATTQSGLVFKAVQTDPATSGSSEPAWPDTLGQTVVDGGVTWEAIAAAYVEWAAKPLMKTGSTEPVWPTEEGAVISDGTMAWEAVSTRVIDENCPNSKIVQIASGKVYAADDDIIRYSATLDPMDWSSENDAGYLPYGMQTYGANPVSAMGLYRGNLVAFNTEGFQMWQVDEDPALSSLLDALPIGSSQHYALAPVSNDLFFLSSQGVRTVGIAAGSTNLQAGDVGMPIDSLVLAQMKSVTRALPLATYYPGAGQYWLAMSQEPLHDVFISGDLPDGYVGQTGVYQYTINGGLAPISVDITEGALPPGASIDDTGRVTYEYTDAGSYTWTVTVTGADGNTAEVEDGATIATLSCGAQSEFAGGESFPSEFTVLLGPDTGTVTLDYLTGMNPDRFVVTFDGVDVIDTGYVGDSSFQSALDANLALRGQPPSTIVQYTTPTDGSGLDTDPGTMHASFVKSTATVEATLRVYGPLEGTQWVCRLGCPSA